jgi:MYXO-CTERM domain-containing protein
VSAESNTVTLNRGTILPYTGSAVASKLAVGEGLLGLGVLLAAAGHRRRRPARR